MPGVGSSKGVSKGQAKTADTTGTGTANAMADYKAFYTAIAKSPTLTTAWSKMLKAAGYYKGPITDKYSASLQRALDNAEQDRQTIAAVRPLERDAFIQEQIAMGQAGGGGATTRKETYLTNASSAAALINAIIRDRDKRNATAEEIKKYTALLNKEQKANPVITNYSDGGSTTSAMQTGGLDAEQYLIDKIAATDEARANKVLDLYSTFMNALGSK